MRTSLDPADTDQKSDMTPMIDVVFLMIIFFLCLDFKTLEAKLPAFLPHDRGAGRESVVPTEQLSVRVHCVAEGTRAPQAGTNRYRLDGHAVRWEVGPRSIADLDSLRAELSRIARSTDSVVPDPKTGERKLIACVVEPQAGVCYDDVARTADVVHASGFADIHFGAGPGRR